MPFGEAVEVGQFGAAVGRGDEDGEKFSAVFAELGFQELDEVSDIPDKNLAGLPCTLLA